MSGPDARRDRHRRLEELFHMGAELPAADHAAFVARHCGDDRALADDLLCLLRQDVLGPKPYLGSPVERAAARAATETGGDRIPEFIDRYHLIEQIGEGGMGLVFRAEQLRPVQREVAIKIPKRHTDIGVIATRFDRERQLLAGFDHPGIVRIFDGGATDRGDPYIVMEHVPGVALTHYCREQRPSVATCVALVTQVCDALQHAHARDVVHADLKATNILVGEDDRGQPFAKVIDFGIARRPAREATDDELDRGLTPTYASPERLRGEPAEARDDVYSVGVLLREALFEARLDATRVATTQRQRLAERELLAITRRASAPTRAARYASMGDLADDLRRWTGGRSVLARRGLRSRVERFVVRQQAVLWCVALAAATVGIALYVRPDAPPPSGASTHGSTHTSAPTTGVAPPRDPLHALEASSSKQLHEMTVLLSEAIALVRPDGTDDASVKLSEILDRVVPHFQHSSCSEGMVRRQAAESFLRLGDYAQATANLRRAFELHDSETVFSRPEWFSLAFHFWQASEEGDIPDRRRLGWRLVNRAGAPLETLPVTRDHLARLVRNTYRSRFHKLEAARADTMKAAATEVAASADDWLILGSVVEFLAAQIISPSAEEDYTALIDRMHRDAVNAFNRCLPPSDPRAVSAQLNLAETRLALGAIDEAEQIARRVLDEAGALLPDNHWRAARARSIVGACLSRRGAHDDATPLLEAARRDTERALGPTARGTQAALRRLIAHQARCGDLDALPKTRMALARAIAFARRSPETMGQVSPAFGGRLDELLWRMQDINETLAPATGVQAMSRAEAHDEAIALIEAAGDWRRRHLDVRSPRAVIFARHLADLATSWPAPAVRVAAATEALIVLRACADRLPVVFAGVSAIVAEHRGQSNPEEAIALIAAARHALDKAGVSTLGGVGAYGTLARVSLALGRPADGFRSLETQWKRLVDEFGIRHHLTVECLDQCAGVASLAGDTTVFAPLVRRHLDDSYKKDDNTLRLKSLALITFSVPGLDRSTYERAMAAAKAIEGGAGDLGCVQCALGMGAFRLGHHDTALNHIKKAVRLHKARNPVDWAYCALIRQALDQRERAEHAVARMQRRLGHRGRHNDRARRAMLEYAAATPTSRPTAR